MNFSALHQQVKQQTDASLLTLIDELPDYAPRLKDAMRHALLAGGKRMRPLLVQVVGNTLDVPKKDQMAISMAIECACLLVSPRRFTSHGRRRLAPRYANLPYRL